MLVVAETYKDVETCRISGTIIMLASDRYLVEFVKKMTAMTCARIILRIPTP
jgi:uncharacterized protein with von Willebrand factor type A (vWA) domain